MSEDFQFFKCRNCNTMFDGEPLEGTTTFHEDQRTARIELACPECGAELDCHTDVRGFACGEPKGVIETEHGQRYESLDAGKNAKTYRTPTWLIIGRRLVAYQMFWFLVYVFAQLARTALGIVGVFEGWGLLSLPEILAVLIILPVATEVLFSVLDSD